jgi:hypothetical protein
MCVFVCAVKYRFDIFVEGGGPEKERWVRENDRYGFAGGLYEIGFIQGPQK